VFKIEHKHLKIEQNTVRTTCYRF